MKCLKERLNLTDAETVCLQCGSKTTVLDADVYFCTDCRHANSDKFKKEFIDSLREEQKVALKGYEDWVNIWPKEHFWTGLI